MIHDLIGQDLTTEGRTKKDHTTQTQLLQLWREINIMFIQIASSHEKDLTFQTNLFHGLVGITLSVH